MLLQLGFLLLSIWFGLSCASLGPADPALHPVAPLPHQLTECSGLVKITDELFVGLNDSGNPAEVYVFSLHPQQSTRVVRILNAENRDWEELTSDDRYLYIGDTGNNSGNRRDLTIYRISKTEVQVAEEVRAERITFEYPEQQNFSPSNTHNFDCEAMVSYGDSLFLFTKNRGDLKTYMYRVPKTPGHHQAVLRDEFNADGLITGATLWSSPEGNRLALLGYTVKSKGYHPLVFIFDPVDGSQFFSSHVDIRRFHGSLQTETILFDAPDKLLVTNEEEHGDKGFMYEVWIKDKP